MGDNRPPRYEEDDGYGGTRVIYRASGLGLCDKIFVALAQGYSPQAYPEWFQEVLDEGSAWEDVIRDAYAKQMETEITHAGMTLETEVIQGVWIRGAIDGILHYGELPVLWEGKKIRDSGWTRYLRSGVEFQANYPMQASAYMHMLAERLEVDNLDLHFTGGHLEQDKDGEWKLTEVVPHIYIDPPVPWRAIAKRIVGLERLIAKADPIGDVACTHRTFPCPMFYLHDQEDEQEPPVRPSDDVIAPLLTEFSELEERIAAGKADQDRLKQVKAEIKAWLTKSGQESGDVSTVKIGDDEYQAKYLTSSRKAHWVSASEATTVTVRRSKKDGESTGVKPVKAAGKKLAAKKSTSKEQDHG